MARARRGGNRLVIQVSDENYITLMASLTPEGETAPGFGAVSEFFNKLLDSWRARRAMESSHDQPAHPAA